MPRVPAKIVLCLSLPCVAGACAWHAKPETAAVAAVRQPGMASRGAAAGADTFDVAYHGVGGAMEAPFKDFGLMRDQIPAVLKRAAAGPYDRGGLDTCQALTEEVAALDLALGPDLDTPDVEKTSDMYVRGAALAGDAALDAMRSAAVGYIPMRSVIRKVSGAEKLEKRTKKAILAGSVRRGFLKAIGMERGCGWPAAPLGTEARPPATAPVTIAAKPSTSAAPGGARPDAPQVMTVSAPIPVAPSPPLSPAAGLPLAFGTSTAPAVAGGVRPVGGR